MAYVVLARKYRPLQFTDMVGQEHVTRTLTHAIENDRVHHAYLFSGARGLGKTTTARILARALVCERGPTPTPCGTCPQCVAVLEGALSDVIEIDGASTNKVEHVRNLREQVHYLPQSARRKIYIIDEVHMLSTSAFNALLKTLEEPPPHVSFMFATTEAHKLLPTILSRVSRLDFRRVSTPQLAAHLTSILEQEGLTMDPGAVTLVARSAGGSVRDSLTLLDQVIAFGQGDTITEAETREVLGLADAGAVAELLDGVLQRDAAVTLSRFDTMIAAGHDLGSLSAQIVEYLRDLTVIKLCGDQAGLVDATDSERQRLVQQADGVEASVLGQLFDRFSRTVDALAHSRTQRLTFEMGLLDLIQCEPMASIGSLVARLEALGSPGAGSGGSGGSGGRDGSRGREGATRKAAPAVRRAEPTAPPAAEPAGRRPQPTPPPLPSSSPPKGGPISDRLLHMARESGVFAGAAAPASSSAPPPATAKPPDREAPAPFTVAAAGDCEPCLPAGRPQPRIEWEALRPFDAWERLLGRVREQDEFLSAVLGELGLVSLEGGTVRLAAPSGSFAHTQCTTRPEIRAGLEQAMRDHFGAPFELELREGEPCLPDLPSLVLVEAQRQADRQAEVERDARGNPAIQRVLSTFGGTLGSVKPLE